MRLMNKMRGWQTFSRRKKTCSCFWPWRSGRKELVVKGIRTDHPDFQGKFTGSAWTGWVGSHLEGTCIHPSTLPHTLYLVPEGVCQRLGAAPKGRHAEKVWICLFPKTDGSVKAETGHSFGCCCRTVMILTWVKTVAFIIESKWILWTTLWGGETEPLV